MCTECVPYAFNVATSDKKEASRIQNKAITHNKKSNLNFRLIRGRFPTLGPLGVTLMLGFADQNNPVLGKAGIYGQIYADVWNSLKSWKTLIIFIHVIINHHSLTQIQ